MAQFVTYGVVVLSHMRGVSHLGEYEFTVIWDLELGYHFPIDSLGEYVLCCS